jgi:hypothetical protein
MSSYNVRFLEEGEKNSWGATVGADIYENRSYLVIERDGKVIREECDGGEPEDASFYRDFGWVPDALMQAYKFGVEDGSAELEKEIAAAYREGEESCGSIIFSIYGYNLRDSYDKGY